MFQLYSSTLTSAFHTTPALQEKYKGITQCMVIVSKIWTVSMQTFSNMLSFETFSVSKESIFYDGGKKY